MLALEHQRQHFLVFVETKLEKIIIYFLIHIILYLLISARFTTRIFNLQR